MSYDAIIIVAGHNGFVTGIYLAKAGWKVLILECNKEDGGIETRIAYETSIQMDPDMSVSQLLYDSQGKKALENIYRQYLGIGRRYDIPMQIGTPTFRASVGVS